MKKGKKKFKPKPTDQFKLILALELELKFGARGGTRTLTPIRTHGPQPCLSTNSSTRAI